MSDIQVPPAVVEAAWVGLVGSLRHGLGTCNQGMDTKCFVCEGLVALQPYHHRAS